MERYCMLATMFLAEKSDLIDNGYKFLFDSWDGDVYFVKLKHAANGSSIVMKLYRDRWVLIRDGITKKVVRPAV